MRKQESETLLLTEAQSLKETLAQTQGAARAFQEKTQYFEKIAKAECKRALQLKEERSKDLEANFLREVTQREEALKTELDRVYRTEQAAVRDACTKLESAASQQRGPVLRRASEIPGQSASDGAKGEGETCRSKERRSRGKSNHEPLHFIPFPHQGRL
eukprot:1156597-Amphidinium_carterae.1